HHSHGNPWLKQLLAIEIPKALMYHNVTPAIFFPHDPHLATFSEQGRKQLWKFGGKIVAAFAASRFSAAELEVHGLKNVQIFPLLDLARSPIATPVSHSVVASPKRRTLLFVGKLTPHKNQAFLIEILSALEKAFPGKYRLVLAGRADP